MDSKILCIRSTGDTFEIMLYTDNTVIKETFDKWCAQNLAFNSPSFTSEDLEDVRNKRDRFLLGETFTTDCEICKYRFLCYTNDISVKDFCRRNLDYEWVRKV